ncbi:MAG: hypothetical protein ABI682_04005 [Acidobacteriota bacterium]
MPENNYRITLTLEALAREEGHIRLSDFVTELDALGNALKKTEALLSGGAEPDLIYRVVSLSHSSPAAVTIEPYRRTLESDFRAPVLESLFQTLHQVDRGEVNGELPYDVLEDLKNMAKPVGRRLASLTLEYRGRVIRLSRELKLKIELALAPEQVEQGSIRGMLESINIHGSANVFRIYPDYGPVKLNCHFPDSLRSEAVSGVGRFVEVRGSLSFRVGSRHPHEVEVRKEWGQR